MKQDDDLRAFGWPDLLTTRRAMAYCGCSKWSLLRAVKSGTLKPVGRRCRTYVFRRAELDQWLVGDDGASADDRPSAVVVSITSARGGRSRSSSTALDRIAETAKPR